MSLIRTIVKDANEKADYRYLAKYPPHHRLTALRSSVQADRTVRVRHTSTLWFGQTKPMGFRGASSVISCATHRT